LENFVAWQGELEKGRKAPDEHSPLPVSDQITVCVGITLRSALYLRVRLWVKRRRVVDVGNQGACGWLA
jgi:hypothetical protein